MTMTILVRIFKNLTRGAWSVQARIDGKFRTIAHAQSAMIDDAVFYVSEASRIRCAAKGQREVHAWVTGDLVALVDCVMVEKYRTPELTLLIEGCAVSSIDDLAVSVSYRPFEKSSFRNRATGEVIDTAPRAAFVAGCTIP